VKEDEREEITDLVHVHNRIYTLDWFNSSQLLFIMVRWI